MLKKQVITLGAIVTALGFGAVAPAIHADGVTPQAVTEARYTDGKYQVNTAYLKQGTTTTSTMANYMNAVSDVTIQGSTARLTISAKSSLYAHMITGFSINGVAGVKSGDAWTFTLPTSVLENTLNGHVDINAIIITESQPFDIKLDMTNVK